MDAQTTGHRIAEARKQKNLTQKELAEQLHISAAAVSKWERGLNFPDLALLEPLAERLDTTPASLLALEDAPAEEVIRDVVEISATQATKRRALQKRAVLLGVICACMPVLAIALAFLIGKDALLAKAFGWMNLNAAALVLGFAGWFAAGVGLFREKRIRMVYVCISLACCAAALYIPTLIVDLEMRFGAWGTVEDTIAGYHFGAWVLMLGTAVLNVIGWKKAA